MIYKKYLCLRYHTTYKEMKLPRNLSGQNSKKYGACINSSLNATFHLLEVGIVNLQYGRT